MDARGDTELAYKMIAERDNETVKIERSSSFVIVAKAQIWASEGWRSSSRMLTANPTRLLNSISCWRPDRSVADAARTNSNRRSPRKRDALVAGDAQRRSPDQPRSPGFRPHAVA